MFYQFKAEKLKTHLHSQAKRQKVAKPLPQKGITSSTG